MKLKLELELIPERQWNQSLAQLLPKKVWDWFRRAIYQKSNYTCSVCGDTGVEVHCHEVWHWDDHKHIQYLHGAQCLCKKCHQIKHWGLTTRLFHLGEITAIEYNSLIDHFCVVNGCDKGTFEAHYLEMGNLWQKRSKHLYKIDWGKWSPDQLIKEYGKTH